MKKKSIRILLIIGLGLLLGAVATGLVGYLMPYMQAENTMPAGGQMELNQLSDGSVKLSWPAGENVLRYQVEILDPNELIQTGDEEYEPKSLYSAWVEEGTEHILPALPQDGERIIRVRSVAEYEFPFQEQARIRYGEQALQTQGTFTVPLVKDLQWKADPDADTVQVDFTLVEGSVARLYHVEADESLSQEMELEEGSVTLQFGGEGAYALPEDQVKQRFCLDAYTKFPNCTYYGLVCEEFTVVREDLLGRELNMEYTEDGENQYLFSWSETKGEYYALECYDAAADAWHEVARVERYEELSCSTGRLEPYSQYRFRIVAVGGQTMKDSPYAASSEEVEIQTASSVLYSTIWPTKDLTIYADPEQTKEIGTATAATAYYVLGLEEGMFRIGTKEGYGYIDSTFCMINLPDFMGDLCSYDITNSYSSKYMAHEYDLKKITGRIIGGYEHVHLGEDTFLVPLLYPTALKLINAAQAAREQGYVLKIYDSFRPRKATSSLYNQAMSLENAPLPGQEVTTPPATAEGETPAEPELVTFGEYMTDNGRYTMNYFLASGYSQHNRGVALDLTLERLEDGRELRMQTAMHDLSHFSEQSKNNGNAYTLYKIMTENGFGGLSSEWWHFQDNETLKAYTLPHLWSGISLQGWVVDDYGWRYRDPSGGYYMDCTQRIDDMEYTFDSYGYVIGEVEWE